MKISLITVGTKMPTWVKQGTDEYLKRFKRDLTVDIVEVPAAPRNKQGSAAKWIATEHKAILNAHTKGHRLGLLDVKGKQLSTEQLSQKLETWMGEGQHWSLVIGGPDGVSKELETMADFRWSLSPLTLPHPLARIVVVEQLYRAWSVMHGHPYHRAD